MPTELFDLRDIDVQQRVRYADDELDALADSIKRYGVLCPIILDDNNVLLDGWRRLNAAMKAGLTHVPVHRKSRFTEAEYFEIELETNIRRRQFTWRENVVAVERVHKTRKREAALNGTDWTAAMTGELLGGYSHTYVWNCMQLAPVLNEKEFNDCDSITDAMRIVLRRKEDAGLAEQAKRMSLTRGIMPQLETKSCIACSGSGKNSQGKLCTPCNGTGKVQKIVDTTPPEPNLLEGLLSPDDLPETVVDLSHTLFNAKSEDILPSWPDECVDHIFTDPPYAIDMDNLQQATTILMDTTRVSDTHQVDENIDLLKAVIPQLYRVLRDGGFCVMWCDVMRWQFLYDTCLAAGFKVQRWPLTWYKTSPCKCQMAHVLTTKNEEFAIVCRKGNATLPSPVTTSVIPCPNDAERLSNPFAKPFDLWKFVIDSFSTKGQTILDPFAGEGTCSLASLKLMRKTLAIELEEKHYNYMLQSVKEHWTSVVRKVKFV